MNIEHESLRVNAQKYDVILTYNKVRIQVTEFQYHFHSQLLTT